MSRIAKSEVEGPRHRARVVALGYGLIVAVAIGGLIALVSLLT